MRHRKVGNKIWIPYTLLVVLLLASFEAVAKPTEDPPTHQLISRIIEKGQQNYKLSQDYGSYKRVVVKKLSKDGKVKKEETKVYRTTWIEGHPYGELIRINDRELTNNQKEKEAKRRSEFIKGIRTQDLKEILEYSSQDLHQKYDFTILPPDQDASYILAFGPKKEKLRQRSRLEKILNHMSGKVWVDGEYNLLRVEAKLTDSVSFGLGLFAKIENIELEYTQQEYEKAVLPASLFLRFKARVALFKKELQEVNTHFYDIFIKPEHIKPEPEASDSNIVFHPPLGRTQFTKGPELNTARIQP